MIRIDNKLVKLLALILSALVFAGVLVSCGEKKKAEGEDPAAAAEEGKSTEKKDAARYTKGTDLWVAQYMIGKDVTRLISHVSTLKGEPEIVPTNDGGGYEGTYEFDGFTAYTYTASEKDENIISSIEPDTSSDVYKWSVVMTDPHDEIKVDERGEYTSKDEVAKYVYTYKRLPVNYITKKEARKLGWKGGKLKGKARGKSIGGDRFGNREKKLPEAKGRYYTECDIDAAGKKSRGAKRLVFSNDGVIFYTDDHYNSFEKLYG